MREHRVLHCTVAAKHHNDAIAGEDITLNLVRLANFTCHKLRVFPIDTPGEIPYTPPPKKGVFSRRHLKEAILT